MKIKQLQWVDEENDALFAPGFFGCFQVVPSECGKGFTASINDANGYDGFEDMDFPTIEEAKAYCQSLLEKQINKALIFIEGETPNKVFLTSSGEYSDYGITGAFSSEENAKKHIDQQKIYCPYYNQPNDEIIDFNIDEMGYIESVLACYDIKSGKIIFKRDDDSRNFRMEFRVFYCPVKFNQDVEVMKKVVYDKYAQYKAEKAGL